MRGAGVVADDGELLHAAVAQREDRILGNAAEAEAADEDGHAVTHAREGGDGVGKDLVHDGER
jgi:hypothetical protein